MKAEETFQLQQLKDVTQSEEANPICPKFLVLEKDGKRKRKKILEKPKLLDSLCFAIKFYCKPSKRMQKKTRK